MKYRQSSTFVQPTLLYIINSHPQSVLRTPNSDFHTQLANRLFKQSHSGALKLSLKLYFVSTKCQKGISLWPLSLKCRFVVAQLMRLQVQSCQGHGYLSVVSVVCCQVDVSVMGQSLVQRSPTKWGVSKAGITWGYFTRYLLISLAS